MSDIDDWRHLQQELADNLLKRGSLTSDWYGPFCRVPRHKFIHDTVYEWADGAYHAVERSCWLIRQGGLCVPVLAWDSAPVWLRGAWPGGGV